MAESEGRTMCQAEQNTDANTKKRGDVALMQVVI